MTQLKLPPKQDDLVTLTSAKAQRDDIVKVNRKNVILYSWVATSLAIACVTAYFMRTYGTAWAMFFTVAGTFVSALAGYLTTKIAGEQNITLAKLQNLGADQSDTLLALNTVVSELQQVTSQQGKRLEETSKDTINALRQQRADRHAMENTEKFFRLDRIDKSLPFVFVRTELNDKNAEKVPYTPVTEDYTAGLLHSLFQPFSRALVAVGIDRKTHAFNESTVYPPEAEEQISSAEGLVFFSAEAATEKAKVNPEDYYVWLREGGIRVSVPRNERAFEDQAESNVYWGLLSRLSVGRKTVFIMSGPTMRGVALAGAFLDKAIRQDGAMMKEADHPGFLNDTEREVLFGRDAELAEDFAAVITGAFENNSCSVSDKTVRIAALYFENDLKRRRPTTDPPSRRNDSGDATSRAAQPGNAPDGATRRG